MTYRYTGTHPDELASGRPVAFGDVVELSRRARRANARLIDEGLLLPIPQAPTTHENQESDQ